MIVRSPTLERIFNEGGYPRPGEAPLPVPQLSALRVNSRVVLRDSSGWPLRPPIQHTIGRSGRVCVHYGDANSVEYPPPYFPGEDTGNYFQSMTQSHNGWAIRTLGYKILWELYTSPLYREDGSLYAPHYLSPQVVKFVRSGSPIWRQAALAYVTRCIGVDLGIEPFYRHQTVASHLKAEITNPAPLWDPEVTATVIDNLTKYPFIFLSEIDLSSQEKALLTHYTKHYSSDYEFFDTIEPFTYGTKAIGWLEREVSRVSPFTAWLTLNRIALGWGRQNFHPLVSLLGKPKDHDGRERGQALELFAQLLTGLPISHKRRLTGCAHSIDTSDTLSRTVQQLRNLPLAYKSARQITRLERKRQRGEYWRATPVAFAPGSHLQQAILPGNTVKLGTQSWKALPLRQAAESWPRLAGGAHRHLLYRQVGNTKTHGTKQAKGKNREVVVVSQAPSASPVFQITKMRALTPLCPESRAAWNTYLPKPPAEPKPSAPTDQVRAQFYHTSPEHLLRMLHWGEFTDNELKQDSTLVGSAPKAAIRQVRRLTDAAIPPGRVLFSIISNSSVAEKGAIGMHTDRFSVYLDPPPNTPVGRIKAGRGVRPHPRTAIHSADLLQVTLDHPDYSFGGLRPNLARTGVLQKRTLIKTLNLYAIHNHDDSHGLVGFSQINTHPAHEIQPRYSSYKVVHQLIVATRPDQTTVDIIDSNLHRVATNVSLTNLTKAPVCFIAIASGINTPEERHGFVLSNPQDKIIAVLPKYRKVIYTEKLAGPSKSKTQWPGPLIVTTQVDGKIDLYGAPFGELIIANAVQHHYQEPTQGKLGLLKVETEKETLIYEESNQHFILRSTTGLRALTSEKPLIPMDAELDLI